MSVRAVRGRRPVASAPVAALASTSVGACLAAALGALDESTLTSFELVLVLRARARQDNHTRGLFLQTLAVVPADEARAALALTRRSAESLAALARELVCRHPVLLDTIKAGDLDQGRARVLAEWTRELCDRHAHTVVDAL